MADPDLEASEGDGDTSQIDGDDDDAGWRLFRAEVC